MTYELKDKVHRFNCDGAACRANHETPADEARMKVAWEEAKADGWVSIPIYTSGILEKWEHYCADCRKRELGDD